MFYKQFLRDHNFFVKTEIVLNKFELLFVSLDFAFRYFDILSAFYFFDKYEKIS